MSDERVCAYCEKPLVRRTGEHKVWWERRQCCDVRCARLQASRTHARNHPPRPCSVEGCPSPARSRGMCYTHWKQARRADPGPVSRWDADRPPPPVSHGWQDKAACAGMDQSVFFPVRGENVPRAKAICAGCPVRVECLEYAQANCEEFGIWGGLSSTERKEQRRARRGTAA
jgi:hypothetical protein